jgi:hypothetical protein
MSIKQKFLLQTDNFINDLYNIFPDNKDIMIFKEKYFLVRKANSNLVIQYFVMYIYPFKEKIMNKDESFFLDGGGQDELKDTSGLKFRDNLKILWLDNMSEENKEIVWKYFKVFVLLCEKYVIEQSSS